MKRTPLTFWQKVKLYFGWCPIHGGWLMTWELGKYKCTRGTETYYA